MSNQLVTSSAQAVSPVWISTELTSIANDPGDDAVDFVVNAFSPKYLGSGTTVDGQLCTQTAVARVAGIGGTPTFSDLQSFGDTIATRQMQGSICSEGWYIVASYDATNGTRIRYTTNHGASWSSYITVSGTTDGSGWMPGLWMSQRNAARAVVSALGSAVESQSWDFTASDGGFTVVEYNGFHEAGNGWRTGATPQNISGTNAYRVRAEYEFASAVDITNANATLTGGWADAEVYYFDASDVLIGTWTISAFGTSGTKNVADSTARSAVKRIQFRRSVLTGAYTGPAYFASLSVTTDTVVSAGAYTTNDYGATWTQITDASIVGHIQPGNYPCGAIDAPYTDLIPYRFVYGVIDDSGTYPVPRLHRVSSSIATNVSPSYDGKTYGVPHSAPHRRAICISVTDANTAILCGESRNATSGTSVYRVFLTRNLWSAVPTWTPLSDESATVEWRGAYIAGDTSNVAYFLGSNGNFGYWNTSKAAATIFDRKGDSTNSSGAVGVCGI